MKIFLSNHAKFIGLNGKCTLYQVSGFPSVSVRPIHCTESSETLGGLRRNEWAVGMRAYILTKGKPKTWYNMHFPFNPINFATFFCDVARNLLNLRAPQ